MHNELNLTVLEKNSLRHDDLATLDHPLLRIVLVGEQLAHQLVKTQMQGTRKEVELAFFLTYKLFAVFDLRLAHWTALPFEVVLVIFVLLNVLLEVA